MNNDNHDQIQTPLKADDSEEIRGPTEIYTKAEIDNTIEVIKMLLKVRNRARKEGKINW